MTRRSSFVVALAGCAFLAWSPQLQASDWLQFNLDSHHSGANLQESTIHTGNVATLLLDVTGSFK